MGSAPKKKAEGLGAVQKGSGDKAVGVGLDSMSVASAVSAPKAKAEGLGAVQKGTGDKAVGVGLDSMSVASAVSAPKAVSEGVPISTRVFASGASGQTEAAGATYDEDVPEEDAGEDAGDYGEDAGEYDEGAEEGYDEEYQDDE